MKLISWLGGLLVLCVVSVSCMVMEEDYDDLPIDEEYEVVVDDGRHWHERYVEDNCNRCPECCTRITENGFIDEYGVERPLDWLPDDEIRIERRPIDPFFADEFDEETD